MFYSIKNKWQHHFCLHFRFFIAKYNELSGHKSHSRLKQIGMCILWFNAFPMAMHFCSVFLPCCWDSGVTQRRHRAGAISSSEQLGYQAVDMLLSGGRMKSIIGLLAHVSLGKNISCDGYIGSQTRVYSEMLWLRRSWERWLPYCRVPRNTVILGTKRN